MQACRGNTMAVLRVYDMLLSQRGGDEIAEQAHLPIVRLALLRSQLNLMTPLARQLLDRPGLGIVGQSAGFRREVKFLSLPHRLLSITNHPPFLYFIFREKLNCSTLSHSQSSHTLKSGENSHSNSFGKVAFFVGPISMDNSLSRVRTRSLSKTNLSGHPI